MVSRRGIAISARGLMLWRSRAFLTSSTLRLDFDAMLSTQSAPVSLGFRRSAIRSLQCLGKTPANAFRDRGDQISPPSLMIFLLPVLAILESPAAPALRHFEHQPHSGFVPREFRQFSNDALDEIERSSAHKEIAMV